MDIWLVTLSLGIRGIEKLKKLEGYCRIYVFSDFLNGPFGKKKIQKIAECGVMRYES